MAGGAGYGGQHRMMSYWQLLMLVLPVFAVIAIGVVVRRVPDRMVSA